MTKDEGHKVGADCGKSQTKPADKSVKKEGKLSKPGKKGK